MRLDPSDPHFEELLKGEPSIHPLAGVAVFAFFIVITYNVISWLMSL